MKPVPIVTYLNENTFGVVTESFKPSISVAGSVGGTIGYGALFLGCLRFGLIIFAILFLIMAINAWVGLSEAEAEKKEEAKKNGA